MAATVTKEFSAATPATATSESRRHNVVRLVLAGLALLALILMSRPAAQPGPEAPAERPAGAFESLGLDGEQPWATDPALQRGMHRILELVEGALASSEDPDYGALSTRLTTEIEGIARTTAIPPESRERLDVILNELAIAAAEMNHAERFDREGGMVRAIQALDAYGAFFDDPAWAIGP